MEENKPQDAAAASVTPTGARFWAWRLVLVIAVAGAMVAVFMSQSYALALLAGGGAALAVASATVPRSEKGAFARDFVIGLISGIAYGCALVAMGLAQAEMPLPHAAFALAPFLAACGALAICETLWSLIDRRQAAEQKARRGTDTFSLVLGMVFGVGLALLCAGYLGIHLPIL